MQTDNSSTPLQGEAASRQSLFVIAINLLMLAVVLALLFNIPALFVLLRAAIRRKIISPFLLNTCVVSLILSTFNDCVALVIHSTTALAVENNSFLCTWLGFVKLFCIQAYASTLCVSNSVSYLAALRASRGLPERLTRKSNAWVLLALWFHCLVLIIPSTGLDLFTTSPSQLTCEPHWSSTVQSHIIYNCFLFITMLLAPLAMCLVVQFQLQRTVKNAQPNSNRTVLLKLQHRKKANRMVIALSLLFLASLLPQNAANFVSLWKGYEARVPRTAFILELFTRCQVVFPPIIYVSMSKVYRNAVFQMLSGNTPARGHSTTGGPGQRHTAPRQQCAERVSLEHRRALVNNRVAPLDPTASTSQA